jgi:hypothetical protein
MEGHWKKKYYECYVPRIFICGEIWNRQSTQITHAIQIDLLNVISEISESDVQYVTVFVTSAGDVHGYWITLSAAIVISSK